MYSHPTVSKNSTSQFVLKDLTCENISQFPKNLSVQFGMQLYKLMNSYHIDLKIINFKTCSFFWFKYIITVLHSGNVDFHKG